MPRHQRRLRAAAAHLQPAPAPCAPPTPTAAAAEAVSTEQLSRFERDGFLFVPSLLSEAQTAAALRGAEFAYADAPLDEINIAANGNATLWMRQRTYQWHRQHPIFVEMLAHPFVMSLADRVLGPGRAHAIAAQCSRINPGATDRERGHIVNTIHADTPFFAAGEREARQEGDLAALLAIEARVGAPLHRVGFSAMWYLRETPVEMGPTEVIRGSHLGLKMWTDDEADASPKLLPSPALDGHHTGGSTIPAGSLLIFNTRSFHRTAPGGNRCDVPRDIVTNAYALPCIQKVQLLHPAAQQAAGDTAITNGKNKEGVYKPPHALLEEGLSLSEGGGRLEGGRGSVLWQLLGTASGTEARDMPTHDTQV